MSNEPTPGANGGQTAVIAPQMPKAGQTSRQEFGAAQLAVSAETAGTALAARERAMTEARFIMAMRNPRDWDDVRTKMLRACERPGFAGSMTEKVWGAAWYRKPIGAGIEGFSVRFAEEAMRAMGNLDVAPFTVYDDEQKRIVTVTVLDLETNNSVTTTVTLDKTVERRSLSKGEEALRVRTNSKGEPTYTIRATDDDVFTKQQNLIAKARRTGILQHLPGDIQAECRTRIIAIREGDIAKDPDGARRKIVDGFAALNVPASEIKKHLGHDLATATPAELADLRDLWTALKEGRVTWAEVLAEPEDVESPGQPAKKTGLDGLTDELKAKAAAAAPPPAQPAEPASRSDKEIPLEHPADAAGAEKDPEPPKAPSAFGKAVAAEEKKRGGQGRLVE